MKSLLTTFSLFFFLVLSYAQNAVTKGTPRLEATYEHISVFLNISGDDNLNSTYTIEYRPQGTTIYLMGAKTLRTDPLVSIDGEVVGRNFHAGSAMFLQPNTTYELRLTLTDPDGGSDVDLITWQTKAEPTPAANGITLYVAPGNGGGNGTIGNPYLGLQTAADNAAAGNIFIVADGTYAPFTLATSGTDVAPIVFQSQNQHQAIIDGGNTDRGIVNIGDFNQTTEQIIFDGFVIQNGTWGIDAENTAFLTIKNNIIQDVDFGFYNRRANGWEHDQTIENNIFIGRNQWPTSGIPPERAIDIRGNNNVVRYNTIQYFGDGISTDGEAHEVSFSMDIHHNDIAYCGDDAIEVDFTVANTRIYRNRCYNSRTGVSVAPVYGGPCYIFRNEFFNQEEGKMNRNPSGLVIVHNTSNKLGRGMSSTVGWQNTYLRNNIIMSTGYVFEEYGLVNNSIDDWDYNAFYSARSGGTSSPWFKWDNVRYANIAALQAGTTIETNGIAISLNDLNNATLPAASTIGIAPDGRNLTLVNGSAARNSGAVLDNINLPFVVDGQPDRGAFEVGQPYPAYGANFENQNIACPINDNISGTLSSQDYLAQNQITSTAIIPINQEVTFPSFIQQLLSII